MVTSLINHLTNSSNISHQQQLVRHCFKVGRRFELQLKYYAHFAITLLDRLGNNELWDLKLLILKHYGLKLCFFLRFFNSIWMWRHDFHFISSLFYSL